MKVKRVTEVETDCPKIGDQISVDHYTATCQKITPKGAIFLLDQYLDKAYPMNRKNTNKGGYAESDLRETLRSKEILDLFDDWGDRMVPFENGDLLRIPFAGEIFGDKLPEWREPDGHEQWPLMKGAHNRAASRCGEPEWGWLANTVRDISTEFCFVAANGCAADGDASFVIGVRPVFMVKEEER